MSIKLLAAVWEHETSGNERAVLQVLCDYANDDGVCWPSIPTVAWKVGCTEQTVRNIFAVLYDKGALVKIEDGGGRAKTNTYRVNLDAIDRKPPRDGNPQNPQTTVRGIRGNQRNPQNPQISDETPKQLFEGNRQIEPSGDSISNEIGDETPKKKPLPRNGPAQILVAEYCDLAGLDEPVNYAKAVGIAQKLVNLGVTPEDIPSLYAAANWGDGADLPKMFNVYERWHGRRQAAAKKKAAPVF